MKIERKVGVDEDERNTVKGKTMGGYTCIGFSKRPSSLSVISYFLRGQERDVDEM